MDTKTGAIVLGGNFIGLGVVRSLGPHGIPIWLFDSGRSISQFSRYTTRVIGSKDDKLDLLLKVGAQSRLDGWVVYPASDADVEMLSVNHQQLSSIYRLTTPPFDVTQYALDKRLTYRRAHELGIATPWTVTGNQLDQVGKESRYPVILKPAFQHHFYPQTQLKALPADTPLELNQAFAHMSKYIPAEEILVQERIPGGGETQFSVAALCKEGKVYGTLVARRQRQYPVDFGGASSFVETVDQPVVEADGRRFLESIGFDGMAEVEFKFDPRDGRYKILDVNTRPWGWNRLGKTAGIDFCYLLWQLKTGQEIAPVERTHSASWFRELNDFLAIAKSPRPADEMKGLLKAMLRGHFTGATFSLRDPGPFVAEFALRVSGGLSLQKKAKEFLTDS
jgi:predicted ATP-grasp superfamily ATP-dependent carboligase